MKVYKAKRAMFKALALVLVLAFVLPTLASAGWKVISNTLEATVKVEPAGNILVTIDTITTDYETMEEALEAIADSQNTEATIKLKASVALDSNMEINGKTINLDLNGNTLAIDEEAAIYVRKGTFNVYGEGTITRDYSLTTAIRVYGSQNVNDTNYTTVNIDKATVVAPYAVAIFDEYKLAYGVTVNITDSTLKNGQNAGNVIHIDGDIQHENNEPVVNVSGGQIIARTDCAATGIAANGNSIFTINGTTIKGDTAVEVKAGTFTIESATLQGSGNYVHDPSDNGTSTQGYALAVVDNENYDDPIIVTVDDVTINGGLITLLRDDEKKETVIFTIKKDVATKEFINAYLDDGLAVASMDDGYYKIVELDNDAINLTWDESSGETDYTIFATANTEQTVKVNYSLGKKQNDVGLPIAVIPNVRFVVKVEGLSEGQSVTINGESDPDGTDPDDNLPYWYLTQAATISQSGSITFEFQFSTDGEYTFHVFAVQVN